MDKLKNQSENGESSIFTLLASLLIIARHLIAFLLASCPLGLLQSSSSGVAWPALGRPGRPPPLAVSQLVARSACVPWRPRRPDGSYRRPSAGRDC